MTIDIALPDQPDGIADDSRDLPELGRAAERVGNYIAANGDGIYDVIDGHPLYARDMEALRRAADMVWVAEQYKAAAEQYKAALGETTAQVADLADKLHKAQQDNASHTKAATTWANENAELRKVVEAVESLLTVTDGDPLGDHGIAISLGEIRRVVGEARAEVAR